MQTWVSLMIDLYCDAFGCELLTTELRLRFLQVWILLRDKERTSRGLSKAQVRAILFFLFCLRVGQVRTARCFALAIAKSDFAERSRIRKEIYL